MYKYTVRAAFLLPLIFVSTDASSDHQNALPVKLSRNQTWPEAVQDNSCVMVGSNMSGVVNTGMIDAMSSDNFTRAWIEAYFTTVWLDFKGCVYGKALNRSEGITVSGDPAKACLLHCNFGGFILTEDICYCSKHVQLEKNKRCKSAPCSCKVYPYCGSGSYASDNIVYNCMCEYGITNDSSTTLEGYTGTCMTATYEGNRTTFQTSNCSSNHSGLCFDLSNPGHFSKSSPGSWSDSFLSCCDRNRQFAGKVTLLNSTPPDIANGIYWVGAFAVSYKLWGNQSTFDNMGCIAIHIDAEHHLITDVIACNSSISALCVDTGTFIPTQSPPYIAKPTPNPSAISYIPDRERISTSTILTSPSTHTTNRGKESLSTSAASTDVSTDTNSYGTLNRSLTKPLLPAIVGSIIGGVLCVVIIAVIIALLRRRGVFTKQPTIKSEDVVCDSLEMTNSQQATNDIYNHLNEIKKEECDDLYDHSFIGHKDEHYGKLCTDKEKHDNDSEYDHTVIMDDTYGHTQHDFGRYDDNNEYDHVCAFPDMTGDEAYGHHEEVNNHENDNEYYDSTQGNTYGQLHIKIDNSYHDNEYNAAQVVILKD